MGHTNVTIYLNDEDTLKYLKDKERYNDAARKGFFKALHGDKEDDNNL